MADENPARGRPFPQGNPGRRRGSKNKATLLANSLAQGEGEALLRKAIELAMGGNVAMMKFLLERILPKERPIQLAMPRLDWALDSVEAMASIAEAVSSGRISPREAADITQVVSTWARAHDLFDAQMEIDRLKERLDLLRVRYEEDNSPTNGGKR